MIAMKSSRMIEEGGHSDCGFVLGYAIGVWVLERACRCILVRCRVVAIRSLSRDSDGSAKMWPWRRKTVPIAARHRGYVHGGPRCERENCHIVFRMPSKRTN